jgi:hypothetical protein
MAATAILTINNISVIPAFGKNSPLKVKMNQIARKNVICPAINA